jgi:hypothetical protein
LGHSTIDEDLASGHEAAFFGSQKRDDFRDLVSTPDTLCGRRRTLRY